MTVINLPLCYPSTGVIAKILSRDVIQNFSKVVSYKIDAGGFADNRNAVDSGFHK